MSAAASGPIACQEAQLLQALPPQALPRGCGRVSGCGPPGAGCPWGTGGSGCAGAGAAAAVDCSCFEAGFGSPPSSRPSARISPQIDMDTKIV